MRCVKSPSDRGVAETKQMIIWVWRSPGFCRSVHVQEPWVYVCSRPFHASLLFSCLIGHYLSFLAVPTSPLSGCALLTWIRHQGSSPPPPPIKGRWFVGLSPLSGTKGKPNPTILECHIIQTSLGKNCRDLTTIHGLFWSRRQPSRSPRVRTLFPLTADVTRTFLI